MVKKPFALAAAVLIVGGSSVQAQVAADATCAALPCSASVTATDLFNFTGTDTPNKPAGDLQYSLDGGGTFSPIRAPAEPRTFFMLSER